MNNDRNLFEVWAAKGMRKDTPEVVLDWKFETDANGDYTAASTFNSFPYFKAGLASARAEQQEEIEALKGKIGELEQIAYCAEGMFDCEVNENLGDAKDWKRQLKIATDEYYDHLFSN